jgi:hypothetical protein
MDITYRPANPEDLEKAERVVQQSANALRVRHRGQPSPAPPRPPFPKFCLAQEPSGLWVAEDRDTIVVVWVSGTKKTWVPTDQVPPGLVPGRGPGPCPGQAPG